MKTTIFLFIGGLLFSLGLRAGNGTIPAEALKTTVKEIIVQECNKWDYSTLNKKNSSASVAFRISDKGEITVEQISASDKEFKNLIESNLPKLKLGDTVVPDGLFYIDLKHRTI